MAASVTGLELDYEGSITVDSRLLEMAGMVPGEQVHVLNVNNGARFITYLIAAPPGSGQVILNGPAARLGAVGDKVIILSYAILDESQLPLTPTVVILDERNRPVHGSQP